MSAQARCGEFGVLNPLLILREKPDMLEVVEILHGRMNVDEHLERLVKESHHFRPRR